MLGPFRPSFTSERPHGNLLNTGPQSRVIPTLQHTGAGNVAPRPAGRKPVREGLSSPEKRDNLLDAFNDCWKKLAEHQQESHGRFCQEPATPGARAESPGALLEVLRLLMPAAGSRILEY